MKNIHVLITNEKSDELSVILDIIKRQCRNGLIELKDGCAHNRNIS